MTGSVGSVFDGQENPGDQELDKRLKRLDFWALIHCSDLKEVRPANDLNSSTTANDLQYSYFELCGPVQCLVRLVLRDYLCRPRGILILNCVGYVPNTRPKFTQFVLKFTMTKT